METKLLAVTAICLVSLTWAQYVFGHHSFVSQYDADKPITLDGVVTKVEWTNPHARIYLDVENEAGVVTNWNLELASPNVLRRFGWRRDSLQPGDEIVVDGALARDGADMASALAITFADGSQMLPGTPDGGN